MSTKSLDLGLSLQHSFLSHELGAPLLQKDSKNKFDIQYLQSYEQIGQKLIEDRLVLSALELYAELAEAGYEVLCLKQFFSNPANFEKTAKSESTRMLVRSLSQVTLDSLDFAPPSEDGDRTGEDKVAVLEFELRKAKETIMALRENLTQQIELENASVKSETESSSSQKKHHSKCAPCSTIQASAYIPEPMRAYEQRAINFLVHEYLLTHGYRLTSITFADENAEQDFEHWDDVGLNMERPADLLSMFRSVHRPKVSHQQPSTETSVRETQTEFNMENDEGDLTMQSTGCCADEIQISNDLSGLKSTNMCIPESFEHTPGASVNSNLSENSTRAPSFHPSQFHSTSRALKDEFQQGVEDVYHKLNNFFSKQNMQVKNSSGTSHITSTPPTSFGGFLTKTHTEKAPFTLFQSK